jgi:signal transduction histidine kinase
MQLSHSVTWQMRRYPKPAVDDIPAPCGPAAHSMRFDDRLDTMLARDLSAETALIATWTQVADLLAQDGKEMAPAVAARGLAALAVLRSRVPVAARAATVRGLARRCRFAPLAVLIASEPAAIAAPLFDRMQLDEHEWIAILPDLGPLPRSRLRHRSDLSDTVKRALSDFGSTDFALAGVKHDAASLAAVALTPDRIADSFPAGGAQDSTRPVPINPSAMAPTGSEIARLVERIENWRQRKPGEAQSPVRDSRLDIEEGAQSIRFACDPDGLVRAIHGVPRGAFVGISLARAADPGEAGVDAGVARAFDKRGPIRQGRMALAVGNPWSGLWTVDADPMFDQATGRFTGYSGTLTLAEDLAIAVKSVAETRHEDTVRQMVHELRSPLNAISGFAQLIDGQYFGPVPTHYGTINRAILRDAVRLNSGIDDLALAAEIEGNSYRALPGETALADALTDFAARHEGVSLGDMGIDAVVPVSAADLAALLDRIRRALDPEENTPVDVDVMPHNGGSDWQIIVSLVAPLASVGSEAARDAARSLAERLAQLHDGQLNICGNSASLNLRRVSVLAEAANRL